MREGPLASRVIYLVLDAHNPASSSADDDGKGVVSAVEMNAADVADDPMMMTIPNDGRN